MTARSGGMTAERAALAVPDKERHRRQRTKAAEFLLETPGAHLGCDSLKEVQEDGHDAKVLTCRESARARAGEVLLRSWTECGRKCIAPSKNSGVAPGAPEVVTQMLPRDARSKQTRHDVCVLIVGNAVDVDHVHGVVREAAGRENERAQRLAPLVFFMRA